MDDVGRVAQVWRYPVKSMQGEQVERLDLAPGGAVGDRRWAVIDPAAGKVLSAKRWPALLLAAARLDSDRTVITLPDGSEHAATDPDVHAALSSWLDRDVRLAAPPDGTAMPMEMHTGMSDETTPVFDWSGPPGTWVDLADAHLLTRASLRSATAAHPGGDWDVRRFRPTALLDVDGDGWVEDAWSQVELGTAACQVLMPTPRCTMPPHPQPGLPADKAIAATLRDEHDNNLGVYASVTRPGTIAVGDRVRVGSTTDQA